MIYSDAFALWETLLADFDRTTAENISDLDFARRGFQRACSLQWQGWHKDIITRFSDEALSWYEDDAECYRRFACLSLGAMLGQVETGNWNETDFVKADALLPGDMMEKLNQICP